MILTIQIPDNCTAACLNAIDDFMVMCATKYPIFFSMYDDGYLLQPLPALNRFNACRFLYDEDLHDISFGAYALMVADFNRVLNRHNVPIPVKSGYLR